MKAELIIRLRTDNLSRKLMKSLHEEFYSLVSDRHIPEGLISDFIILSQSALWKHRMVQDPPVTGQSTDKAGHTLSPTVTEARIFSHVLALHQALLEVGLDQLKEPPPLDAAENDLAQRITAVFRRTLPALRIASKWLLANFSYVAQGADGLNTTGGFTTNEKARKDSLITAESIGIPGFWKAYANFMRALSRAFPSDRLPAMDGLLDEDVEMRGFLPLRSMMGQLPRTVSEDEANTVTSLSMQRQDQAHPNVLQLMRIADLLDDAKKLVNMEVSRLTIGSSQNLIQAFRIHRSPFMETDSCSKVSRLCSRPLLTCLHLQMA